MSASKDDISQRVVEIIADQLGVHKDQVLPETRFREDLGADSLDTVELVMSMEEDFDVSISDETAEKLVCVQDVIDHIKNS